MNFKKNMSFLLVLTLGVTLVGCANNDNNTKPNTNDEITNNNNNNGGNTNVDGNNNNGGNTNVDGNNNNNNGGNTNGNNNNTNQGNNNGGNNNFYDDFDYREFDDFNEFGEGEYFGPIGLRYTSARLVNNGSSVAVTINIMNNGNQPVSFNELFVVRANQGNHLLNFDQANTSDLNARINAGASANVEIAFNLVNPRAEVEVDINEAVFMSGEDLSFDLYPDILN